MLDEPAQTTWFTAAPNDTTYTAGLGSEEPAPAYDQAVWWGHNADDQGQYSTESASSWGEPAGYGQLDPSAAEYAYPYHYDAASGQYYDATGSYYAGYSTNECTDGYGEHGAEVAEVVEDTAGDVVEAEAVDVVEGVVALEATDEPSAAGDAKRMWSCGQCTFLNPISEAFCEICLGHISLSPDKPLAPSPTEPSADQEDPPSSSRLLELTMGTADESDAVSLPPQPTDDVPMPPPSPAKATPMCVDTSNASSLGEVAMDCVLPPAAASGVLPSLASPTYSGPSPTNRSLPVSPAFLPSAPDFDELADGDDSAVDSAQVQQSSVVPIDTTVASPGMSMSPGKPSKDASVDFLALAFQGSHLQGSNPTSDKQHLSRQEEQTMGFV